VNTLLKSASSRRALALQSIVLMLLIVAGMIALGIPAFHRQRDNIRIEICQRTLARIFAAKVHYASDNDIPPGAQVTLEQLAEHGKIFTAQDIPGLPLGASDLKIGTIGTQPSCVYDGKTLYAMPDLLATQPPAES
jgi:hypothetical protein